MRGCYLKQVAGGWRGSLIRKSFRDCFTIARPFVRFVCATVPLSAFVSENKFVPGIMDEAIAESRERVTGNVDEILARLSPSGN